MISKFGSSALFGKLDINSAFLLIPVDPADFGLLRFSINGLYFMDKCLLMGCFISLYHHFVFFIFAGKGGCQDCASLMSQFTALIKEIGVLLAEDKTAGPTTQRTFLGFEIDTVDMIVRIHETKLNI